MKKLKHDNIIKLHEVHESKHKLYLVITLVNGGNLTKAILTDSFTHEWQIRLTLYNLLQVLSYIHDKHIVHRDLKPDNILVKHSSTPWEILLADFGFALNEFEDEDFIIF